MARSELQELYERAWHEKQELRGYGRGMTGHYCVFLKGKYLGNMQQEDCACRNTERLVLTRKEAS